MGRGRRLVLLCCKRTEQCARPTRADTVVELLTLCSILNRTSDRRFERLPEAGLVLYKNGSRLVKPGPELLRRKELI